MTPQQLRKAMPDGSIRALGDAGKKLGMSSTLPTALRFAEAEGRVQRVPIDHKLDQERYRWGLRTTPLERPADDLPGALAERYFSHASPATLKEAAAWSGASQRDLKPAIARLGLQPVAIETLGPAVAPAGLPSPPPPRPAS